MRRFKLVRAKDISGVSGVGYVAEGCQFTKSGQCVLTWNGDHSSVNVYKSIDDVVYVHGHEGTTTIEWVDDELHDL